MKAAGRFQLGLPVSPSQNLWKTVGDVGKSHTQKTHTHTQTEHRDCGCCQAFTSSSHSWEHRGGRDGRRERRRQRRKEGGRKGKMKLKGGMKGFKVGWKRGRVVEWWRGRRRTKELRGKGDKKMDEKGMTKVEEARRREKRRGCCRLFSSERKEEDKAWKSKMKLEGGRERSKVGRIRTEEEERKEKIGREEQMQNWGGKEKWLLSS